MSMSVSQQSHSLKKLVTARFAPGEDWAPEVTPFDVITGTNGNDTLVDTPGNDLIDALDGDDSITVTNGQDTVNGGTGSDRLIIDYSAASAALVTQIGPAANGGLGGFDGAYSEGPAGSSGRLISYTSIERFSITSGSGNDDVTTGSGNDYFGLQQGGNDIVNGGDGDDGFFFGAAFTAADQVNGGAGANDQIGLSGDYTGANALTLGVGGVSNIAGVEVIAVLPGSSYSITAINANLAPGQLLTIQATQLGAGDSLTFNGAAETDGGKFILYGGLGNDNFTGGSGNDTLNGAGGNDTIDGGTGGDTMIGGTGNDIFIVDSLADIVTENNGEGTDEVRTALASYTLAANVERLTGTATSGAQTLRGNALDNVIAGASGADLIYLEQGGNDIVNGGDGDDGFWFGGAFTAADQVNGGAGANDQIGLNGFYTGGNALVLGVGGVSNIAGVEVIAVFPGSSYSITAINANLAPGQLLTIQATQLQPGDRLTFNGAAETDGGRFIVFGGLGNDNLTGGSGDDGFFFGRGRFSSGDIVVGGAGSNDQLGLDGDYGSVGIPFELSGSNVSGIELVALLQKTGSPANSYVISTAQNFVAPGMEMTIWGILVQTRIVFNGAAETDGGKFKIFGGTAADTLTGGAGDDWVQGGLGGDSMTGGAGVDTFAYTAVAQSTGVNFDRLIGFDDNADKIDLPGTVASFAAPTTGTLNLASFDTGLAAGVDAALRPNQAIIFTANGGDMNGRTFAVVDTNGDGDYQAGSDYVFEFVAPASPIDQLGMFI